MYTFSQLLLRNCILGIVFSLIVVLFSILAASKYLQEKQNNHASIIKANSTLLLNDGLQQNKNDSMEQVFIESLHSNYKYTLLKVTKNPDTNIYNASNPIKTLVLPYTLPKVNKLNVKNNLTIIYQLDFSNESSLIIEILSLMLGLTFIFIFIASLLSSHSYKAVLKKLCDDLKTAIKSDFSENEVLKDKTPGEFDQIFTELKKLVNTHHLSTTALEEKAFLEPVTKLSNRSRFVQYFENQISRDQSIKFGVLSITRCSELQTINQIHGYNAGDTYICGVAEIMKGLITKYQGAQLFRLNSSDFATIIPNSTMKSAESYAKQLTEKFNSYQQVSDLDSVAFTGLVAFQKDKPLGELLALADTGISIAQTQHRNSWHAQTDTDILESASASYGNQNWRQEIDNVIENQRITLLVQNIKPSNRNVKVYGEVLARFLNSNDEMLPTASFVAMAEKLDKIVAIDKMIIEKVISEITNKNLTSSSYGINVSTRSIHDEHFLIWLERRLLRDPAIASRLIFEITEYGLQQNIKTSKRFIDMIHRAGSKVTVERFGVGLTSFKFFKDLKPDFIKMDSTYTRDIDEDKNNQYFLRLMVDLAHRLSISVLAESVEGQEEKFALEKLFIDGCQGFYIGKPLPL
ncbi:EAL domain-containing protein [Colwellia sp. UCD-KL20]|uniref:EAL domain-containing protein n=1 Tax=Colwellia sp. UCD-KL20 TaxID=1917165 RepID=UPI000970E099|nr:EAL domain-containing protein [Colwellia sp. UCD-KL20]